MDDVSLDAEQLLTSVQKQTVSIDRGITPSDDQATRFKQVAIIRSSGGSMLDRLEDVFMPPRDHFHYSTLAMARFRSLDGAYSLIERS